VSVLQEIYVAELDSRLGDFEVNVAAIVAATSCAVQKNYSIVATPELSICGYPPQDLVSQAAFRTAAAQAFTKLKTELKHMFEEEFLNSRRNCTEEFPTEVHIFVGNIVEVSQQILDNSALHSFEKVGNAYIELVGIINESEVRIEVGRQYLKRDLPSYYVFDEQRNFVSGLELELDFVTEFADKRIAVAVCEDIWNDVELNVPDQAQVLLVPNASPFEVGKVHRRMQAVQRVGKRYQLPVLYFNAQGAQDELVFDRCVLSATSDGQVTVVTDGTSAPTNRCFEAEMYSSIVTGLRTYFVKNGFSSCVFGLSGGIDSALVAVLSADAIGAENVIPIAMPSKYSSVSSMTDAEQLVANIGCQLQVQPIEDIFNSYQVNLQTQKQGQGLNFSAVALENLQARIRGNIVMAYSNSSVQPCLALATGNKSELAVGYSTIYGDAVGGFAPIKDVLKSEVWQLAKWRNSLSQAELSQLNFKSLSVRPIPDSSITKPPSAELRPNQFDQDTLPDYYLLDAAICQVMNIVAPEIDAVRAAKVDDELLKRTGHMSKTAQWKRLLYPIGPKLSTCSFGSEWRYPISYTE
jgi:NAD+ synthase (glutamine-hydrolysing)